VFGDIRPTGGVTHEKDTTQKYIKSGGGVFVVRVGYIVAAVAINLMDPN